MLHMFKVNNTDNRATSMTSFWFLYCQLQTYSTPFSDISGDDFEQFKCLVGSKQIQRSMFSRIPHFLLTRFIALCHIISHHCLFYSFCLKKVREDVKDMFIILIWVCNTLNCNFMLSINIRR